MNSLINPADNKLANDSLGVPTESNGSPASTSRVFSCFPLPGPALISVPVPLFVVPFINNELFKKFMEAYLAAQAQPSAPTTAQT